MNMDLFVIHSPVHPLVPLSIRVHLFTQPPMICSPIHAPSHPPNHPSTHSATCPSTQLSVHTLPQPDPCSPHLTAVPCPSVHKSICFLSLLWHQSLHSSVSRDFSSIGLQFPAQITSSSLTDDRSNPNFGLSWTSRPCQSVLSLHLLPPLVVGVWGAQELWLPYPVGEPSPAIPLCCGLEDVSEGLRLGFCSPEKRGEP